MLDNEFLVRITLVVIIVLVIALVEKFQSRHSA